MRIRMLHPAVSLVAILLLAGCVPTDPIITPAPEPDAAPIFASDEEALAAATDAYANFVRVSDAIFQNGAVDTSGLTEVAVGDLLASTKKAFNDARERGLRSVGQTTFDQVSLQQFGDNVSGEGVVVTYVCEDVSGVDVLDSHNKSVVSPDRPDRVLYEVTFDMSNDGAHLIASNRNAWSTESC
ncbi:MAG: hypothetical protein KF801_07955 [Cryobacterium sp.]|nr:hypothetical protein [Cryobacterium sp.]